VAADEARKKQLEAEAKAETEAGAARLQAEKEAILLEAASAATVTKETDLTRMEEKVGLRADEEASVPSQTTATELRMTLKSRICTPVSSYSTTLVDCVLAWRLSPLTPLSQQRVSSSGLTTRFGGWIACV